MTVKVKTSLPSLDAKNFNKAINGAGAIAAMIIEGSAKTLVPKDTGLLVNSIGTFQKGLSWFIGSAVHYAPYIEYGTKRMSAKPYLRPAGYNNMTKIKNAISAYIGRFI
jgi:HK97 gp10 family phage protein